MLILRVCKLSKHNLVGEDARKRSPFEETGSICSYLDVHQQSENLLGESLGKAFELY